MAGEYDNDYSVLTLDLANYAGANRAEIVQNGRPIAAVTIIQLPAGAVGQIMLHFGETADGIPLRQEGFSIGRSPARTNGLYLTVAPGQSGIFIVMIGLDLAIQS